MPSTVSRMPGKLSAHRIFLRIEALGSAQSMARSACFMQACKQPLIPTCTLRCHSKMGKIGQRVKKLRIVLKLSQLIAKGVNNGIKGDKDPVRKSFFS